MGHKNELKILLEDVEAIDKVECKLMALKA
jgi:hypothetical protein